MLGAAHALPRWALTLPNRPPCCRSVGCCEGWVGGNLAANREVQARLLAALAERRATCCRLCNTAQSLPLHILTALLQAPALKKK